MAFHAMVNQKGMQEEILNEQLCTQQIQTHQYKNKRYASDVSVCFLSLQSNISTSDLPLVLVLLRS